MKNSYIELIKKLDEYIEFINKVNQGPMNIAWAHGWRCSQEDIEKGEQLRKEIENLRKASKSVINTFKTMYALIGHFVEQKSAEKS